MMDAAVNTEPLFLAVQWLFVGYVVAMNSGYLALYLLSVVCLRRSLEGRALDVLPKVATAYQPPVTIIVGAHNEQASISPWVRALLHLDYPEFEIIVVNDGSRDATLSTLRREFRLALFPEAAWKRLSTRTVHGIYRSALFPNLRVIDKAHGGKADALNAGVNAARYPLLCSVNARSILQRHSLSRIVQPFLEDPVTIAAGASPRIANGSAISDALLTKVGLPRQMLGLMQIVEYLRTELFSRMAWSVPQAALVRPGAITVFRKEAIVSVGGYRTDVMDPDIEVILRLHRLYRLSRKPYRIALVPDPVCWIEAPETLAQLRRRRMRWQRGLSDALMVNRGLVHPRGGAAGWLAFPYVALFEWLGPLLEVTSYAAVTAVWLCGGISTLAFLSLLLMAAGFGVLVSVSALTLEEASFRVYAQPRRLGTLLTSAVAENLGYRQLQAWWGLRGLWQWLHGARDHPDGRKDAQQKPPRPKRRQSSG